MATLVGGICTSHIPAIGNAIARGLQDDPYWQPFFAGYPPVREWLERVRARRRGHRLQRSRPELLPRQSADVRGRRGARVPQRRRGLGLADAGAVPRRPESVVAHHRVARETMSSTSRRAKRCASITRSRCRKRCCGPAAGGPSRPCRSPSTRCSIRCPRRPAASSSARRSAARSRRTLDDSRVVVHRDRRPVAPARRRARRVHQQGIRSDVPREDRRRPGSARRATRSTTSCVSPARRASSSSCGS